MSSAQDWLDRKDPRAVQLSEHGRGSTDAAKAALAVQIGDANRRVFLRECASAGIDPALGVSPSLLKILGEKNA